MGKINLKNLGVSELTHHETVIIEGGSWLSRVWDQLVTPRFSKLIFFIFC